MNQIAPGRILADVAAVFTVTLLATGCSRESDARTSGGDAGVPVSVAVAIQRDVPIQINAIGWVEAFRSVTIKPQVDGLLTEVHFTEGQELRAGDKLFTLDARPFQAAVQLAEANLLRDQAMADDAAHDYERTLELFQKKAAAERERQRSQADYEAKLAQVKADQAGLESAKIRLDYCSIRSPIDGRIGAKLVDVGSSLKANETALVIINQIEPIFVSFSVAEKHLDAIKQAQAAGPVPVSAAMPGDSEPIEQGELAFIDNQVDSLTGMIRLKATFANKAHRLWPGLFIDVTMTVATLKDSVVIPTEAVQVGQAGPFVYVLKPDQTVEMRPIELGDTQTTGSVIKKGITVGETVVTDGQLRLVPNARALIKDAARPPQESSK